MEKKGMGKQERKCEDKKRGDAVEGGTKRGGWREARKRMDWRSAK